MKGFIILFVLIVVLVTCGCVGSPANVAKDVVPGVLKNVSADISAMETPNITIGGMLQPIKTSVDYIQPARLIPTPVTIASTDDPIVGNWIYAGSSYRCGVLFYPDRNGSMACSISIIPIADKSFKWNPASVPTSFNWMRNYTVMDVSNGNNYSVMYSEHTGKITSDIIPDQGYLVKVS